MSTSRLQGASVHTTALQACTRALLALLALHGTAAAQVSAPPELEPGAWVEGRIEDGAPAVTTERLAADYTDAPIVGLDYRIEVERAGPYFLDLRSVTFDAYLVLRDAAGAVVAEDDDGLVATHARITTELAAGVSYRLQVCALHGQRGEFQLRLEPGKPEPGEGIEWTKDEIRARKEAIFPKELWKKVEVVESKYYLIFTDGGAGKSFGKILDKEIYAGFRELFPFDEPEHVRQLPIYLFNTRERYVDFIVRYFKMERLAAEATGGIAFSDFYSTSYSSPRDPTHFHECAHQIMSNVLGLSGGGSWYQEGVAEYYEDKVSKFNRQAETRMAIRTEQSVGLRELFSAPSMLFSASEDKKGGGGAAGMYGQAASVILFLKEGPHKKLFAEFLQRMGKTPRGKVDAIEAVFQGVYGLSIEQLEAEWREYFAG